MSKLTYNFKNLKVLFPITAMFGAFLLDIVTLEGLLFFIIMQQSLLRFNLNVKFKALVTENYWIISIFFNRTKS